MGPEDPAHPGLGQRLPGGGAAQDHEAFRRPGSLAGAPRAGKRPAQRRTHGRRDALPAALARHPDPAQPHVHGGQPQRPHLGGPQSAQQHRQHDRPVPEGPQVREEHHVAGLEGVGQPAWLAHQPPAAPRPASPDVPQQAPRARAQTAGPAGGRHRIDGPHPRHHRELEQAADRGDPPVHRGRRGTAPFGQPDNPPTRRAGRPLLPVQVIKQVGRHHIGKPGTPPGQEPQEIQQIVGIRPHRRGRERPRPQMRKELAGQPRVITAAAYPVTITGPDDVLRHGPSPRGHPARVCSPPGPHCGTSASPGVSSARRPVNGDEVDPEHPVGVKCRVIRGVLREPGPDLGVRVA